MAQDALNELLLQKIFEELRISMFYVCCLFVKDHWENFTDVPGKCIIDLTLEICHDFVDKRLELLLHCFLLLNNHFLDNFLPFFLSDRLHLNTSFCLYFHFFNSILWWLFHISLLSCFLIHFDRNFFLLFTLFFHFSLSLFLLILLHNFLYILFDLNFHFL